MRGNPGHFRGHFRGIPTAAHRRIALNNPHSLDGLHLIPVPLVPEIRLFLAADAILLWARLEAAAGHRLPPPFWASAWIGGQALARYILDNPQTVADRRVFDLASGSGLVAIAAALAGAREVIANDIDPYAIAAIRLNAGVNNVRLRAVAGEMMDGDAEAADVVLAGDALYDPPLALRTLPFLARVTDRGGHVLIGDPDRGHLSHDRLQAITHYRVPRTTTPEDAQIEHASVLTLRPNS